MKELDVRDTGLRELTRQTTNISGCFGRKKDVGATASVNVDSPLQAVEWLLLLFVYYRLSHTREGMQTGDQENERYGVKANAAHHTHRSEDTL